MPTQVLTKDKSCFFCQRQIEHIDYKDTQLLRRFMSGYAKISTSRRSGACTRHQRKVAQAVKRARMMALVPFTVR